MVDQALLFFHNHVIDVMAFIITALGTYCFVYGLYKKLVYECFYKCSQEHSIDLINGTVQKLRWKQFVFSSLFSWAWLYFYFNGYFG